MLLTERQYQIDNDARCLAERYDGDVESARVLINSLNRLGNFRRVTVERYENDKRFYNPVTLNRRYERENRWEESLNTRLIPYRCHLTYYGMYPEIVTDERPTGNFISCI